MERGSEVHQTQWVNACKQGYGAFTSSSFDKSGLLAETVLMGNLAVRSYNYRKKTAKEKYFIRVVNNYFGMGRTNTSLILNPPISL
ncbi:MAG: hypothetical protein ABI861_09310 [Panacibacter sp.]